MYLIGRGHDSYIFHLKTISKMAIQVKYVIFDTLSLLQRK